MISGVISILTAFGFEEIVLSERSSLSTELLLDPIDSSSPIGSISSNSRSFNSGSLIIYLL